MVTDKNASGMNPRELQPRSIPIPFEEPLIANSFGKFLYLLKEYSCQHLVVHAQEMPFDLSPTKTYGDVGVFFYIAKYVALTYDATPVIYREVCDTRHGSDIGRDDAHVRLLSDYKLLSELHHRIPEIRAAFPDIYLTLTWKDGVVLDESELTKQLADLKYNIPSTG